MLPVSGSAIKTTLNLSSRTEVSFDWEFLTNETSNVLLRGSFNDYGFFFLGQDVTKLADWTNANQTNCDFSFDSCTEVKTKTLTLNPGQYGFGFGVIDIDDFVVTSALRISSFTLTPISQPPVTVPEPNLILGLFATLGLGRQFLGKKTK